MDYVTDLDGVYANAVCAGIRGGDSRRLDLGYLYVPECVACSVLGTQNHFKSASVIFSVENSKACVPKLLVVNSGNSNAATGKKGMQDVLATASLASNSFDISDNEVLVASTGIIGVPLPIEKIVSAFPTLAASRNEKNGHALAKAILTTDLVEKFAWSERISSSGVPLRTAGIAKGSGMIAPNMGTMFAFLVVNAPLTAEECQSISREVVSETFNMMSVDTDTSTSDMFVLFSNAAGTQSICLSSEDKALIKESVREVALSLSLQIARDGEGASKLVTARVCGAANSSDARKVAKSIIDSPLVKTAMHGADPNWGRVLMAIGKHPDVKIDPERVVIKFGSTVLFREGEPCKFSSDLVRQYLLENSIEIVVDLGLGEGAAHAYGCDLTREYVDINTCYN